jgi:hypothetical protein
MMGGVVDRRRPAKALQRKQPAILRSFHGESSPVSLVAGEPEEVQGRRGVRQKKFSAWRT